MMSYRASVRYNVSIYTQKPQVCVHQLADEYITTALEENENKFLFSSRLWLYVTLMEISPAQKTALSKPPIGKGVFIIALFLIVVFGIWRFSSGFLGDILGSENATSTAKKTSVKKISVSPESLELSYYNNWVKFIPVPSVKESYPEKEYAAIEVTQPNLSGTDATNWVLENSQGEKVILGKATPLYISGKVNATSSLQIKAGDRLIISTGRSPVGVSFRVNKCSPYLEQFQDFVPPLSGECPYVSSEKNFYSLPSACQIFIQSMPRCETTTLPLPPDSGVACKTFLDASANYNGCVATHKNDPDFYLKEWRIFLRKDKELWSQPNDTIMLLDEKGKLIDSIKY
jgi:hypothetical protein